MNNKNYITVQGVVSANIVKPELPDPMYVIKNTKTGMVSDLLTKEDIEKGMQKRFNNSDKFNIRKYNQILEPQHLSIKIIYEVEGYKNSLIKVGTNK